jgi:hypothetical protein
VVTKNSFTGMTMVSPTASWLVMSSSITLKITPDLSVSLSEGMLTGIEYLSAQTGFLPPD